MLVAGTKFANNFRSKPCHNRGEIFAEIFAEILAEILGDPGETIVSGSATTTQDTPGSTPDRRANR
jgi:hypothetical protein